MTGAVSKYGGAGRMTGGAPVTGYGVTNAGDIGATGAIGCPLHGWHPAADAASARIIEQQLIELIFTPGTQEIPNESTSGQAGA
jgi:hypothetical protein